MRELKLQGEANGWQCWQMPMGKMPLAPEGRASQAQLLLRLSQTLSGVLQLTPSLWIEATHLFLDGANRLLGPNAAAWVPRQGFGVHPAGTLPRLWTEEDFAEAPFGHKPPVFNNQVWEVSRQAGHAGAIDLLAGRGVLSLLLLAGTADVFKAEATAALKPLVTERVFNMYGFFFPLLTAEALGSAALPHWLGNARVYVREVFEDKSLLVLSSVPLEAALERLGARRTSPTVFTLPEEVQALP